MPYTGLAPSCALPQPTLCHTQPALCLYAPDLHLPRYDIEDKPDDKSPPATRAGTHLDDDEKLRTIRQAGDGDPLHWFCAQRSYAPFVTAAA